MSRCVCLHTGEKSSASSLASWPNLAGNSLLPPQRLELCISKRLAASSPSKVEADPQLISQQRFHGNRVAAQAASLLSPESRKGSLADRLTLSIWGSWREPLGGRGERALCIQSEPSVKEIMEESVFVCTYIYIYFYLFLYSSIGMALHPLYNLLSLFLHVSHTPQY